MKKTLIIVTTVSLLIIGSITAAYALDNNTPFNCSARGSMMNSNNATFKSMVDVMRNNGFDVAAKAMETGDYKAMQDFMKNMTDEQYNKMIQIMNDNGYKGMGRMMGSFSKNQMLRMHNSMMGSWQ